MFGRLIGSARLTKTCSGNSRPRLSTLLRPTEIESKAAVLILVAIFIFWMQMRHSCDLGSASYEFLIRAVFRLYYGLNEPSSYIMFADVPDKLIQLK